MSTNHKIFSLSKQLKSLNTNLSEHITVISKGKIASSISKYPFASLIFEERHIPKVLNLVKAKEKQQFRFICISQNFASDDRLLLLNNNIECITSEKYTQISISFFDMTQTNNNYKVLIVEDDESHKNLTEHVLQKAGIAFHSITKGEDTLEAIGIFKPDLILLDLYLDGIDGDEVVKIIRKNKNYALLPIVVLTADTSNETRMKVLNAGADDLFSKSIDSDLMVSSLINRIQKSSESKHLPIDSKHKQQDTNDSTIHDVKALVEKEDSLSDKLTNFLNDNRNNKSASILFLKAGNKQSLQKKLGYEGFDILCGLLIKQLPEFDQKFNIKEKLAEGAFVFASVDFNQEQAVQWVKELKRWLLTNLFSLNNKEYFFEVVAVVLSDFPSQNNEKNLLRKAENLLLERDHSKNAIVIGAETTKEQSFEKIKSQLEHSIKTRDFHWHYNQILSTKDESKKIYQLEIALHCESGEELMSEDYLDVAVKSGMLRLLNNFTFEHAIRIIRDGEQNKVETVVLLEQNLLNYKSPELTGNLLETIKKLNLPNYSIVFQFSLSDAKNHLSILGDIAMQLKAANILICLSEFTPEKSAWEIARKLHTNWIKLKPIDESNSLIKRNKSDNLEQIINKSNILCYEVLVGNVDNFDLAIKLTDLNIDYIQGKFISAGFNSLLK